MTWPESTDLEQVPVVVVGAGPTGLTVAALLAQRGVRTVVLERYTEPYALPRAVHADDEVLRILQELGLAAAFAAISRPVPGLRLLDSRHRTLAEFTRERGVLGHPQSNLFDQPDLEDLLRHKASQLPRLELRPGVELVDLVDRGAAAQIQVTCRDVGTGRPRRLVARAVLGCDGANSTVRELIGSQLDDLRFDERWLVVDARCTTQLDVWDGVEQVCDPRRAGTFMQVGAQRYRWEFQMFPGETVEVLTTRQSLQALLAPWVAPLVAHQVQVVRAAEYTFRARVADRWQHGGVFLLGDAAHQTPPFIGQGMGLGLRDAHNLAWKLALVVGGHAAPELLATYPAERRPAARAMVRSAVLAGWAMTGGQDAAAVLRRAVLAGVVRVPGGTRTLASTASPRLTAGPLVHRAVGRRGDPAGRACPQPWVTDVRGRLVRLDDILGAGFAVVTDGPVDPQVAVLAAALDAVTVDVGPGADAEVGGVVPLDSPELRRWLRRAGVRCVLVRPDRVVLVAVPRRAGRAGARRLRAVGIDVRAFGLTPPS